MKKTLVVILSILAVFSVFSAFDSDLRMDEAFVPVDVLDGISNTLYRNQAKLSENYGFNMTLPQMSVSLHGISPIMASEEGSEILADIFKSPENVRRNIVALVGCLIEETGYKFNKIGTADVNLGFSYNSFAFGINSEAEVKTYNPGSQITSIKAVAQADVSMTFAYGRAVFNDGQTKLSLGVALRPSFKVFTKTLDAGELATWNSTDLSNLKLNAGLALPFDLSASVTRFNGKLVFNAQLANINGVYYVNKDFTYNQFEKNILPTSLSEKLKTHPQVNLWMTYRPDLKYINPEFYLAFNDVNGYFRENSEKDSTVFLKNALMYLDADIKVDLLNVLRFTVGVNGGYLFGSASFRLGENKLEVVYKWNEFGDELGEKPVDTVTAVFRLGL